MGKFRHKRSPEEKRNIIQRIVAYLESAQPEMLTAYVFGSFVKDKPFADIDIAILFSTVMNEPLNDELDIENNIEKLISIPVDVRVMNAAPLSFQYQVIHDGWVIIDLKPQHRADYEGQILKQYFDFSRYRKRYLKEAVYAPL
jgi:hypothetical protein